jgi:lanthanide-dependent methanol dehydrogenase
LLCLAPTRAWTFSTGVPHGREGQALVVNNTMYLVAPHPNIVYAIDLNHPEGPLKWKCEPSTDPAARGVACCDVVNRGAGPSLTPCGRKHQAGVT